ncbi:MAG: hypothetical protein JWQ43_3019 [Glaciihabitans sp.]|nr:hypothetical protein [Glaciihabitans sp.]
MSAAASDTRTAERNPVTSTTSPTVSPLSTATDTAANSGTGSRDSGLAVILAPVGDALRALIRRDPAAISTLRALAADGRITAVLLGAESLQAESAQTESLQTESRQGDVAHTESRQGDVAHTDPSALAAVLARAVPGLGVIVTTSSTNDHPYNFARRSLTLDHLTGARAGVLFAAGDPHEAERIRVVRELWNSYPVSSIVGDRGTGVFAVLDNVRDIAHVGDHYSVAGALNTPSSRQGEPVSLLFSADGSGAGTVDIVLVGDVSQIPADTAGSLYYLLSSVVDDAASTASTTPGQLAGRVLTVANLDDTATLETSVPATSPATSPAAGAALAPHATLRESLGLAERSIDLSARPLTFEGTK